MYNTYWKYCEVLHTHTHILFLHTSFVTSKISPSLTPSLPPSLPPSLLSLSPSPSLPPSLPLSFPSLPPSSSPPSLPPLLYTALTVKMRCVISTSCTTPRTTVVHWPRMTAGTLHPHTLTSHPSPSSHPHRGHTITTHTWEVTTWRTRKLRSSKTPLQKPITSSKKETTSPGSDTDKYDYVCPSPVPPGPVPSQCPEATPTNQPNKDKEEKLQIVLANDWPFNGVDAPHVEAETGRGGGFGVR